MAPAVGRSDSWRLDGGEQNGHASPGPKQDGQARKRDTLLGGWDAMGPVGGQTGARVAPAMASRPRSPPRESRDRISPDNGPGHCTGGVSRSHHGTQNMGMVLGGRAKDGELVGGDRTPIVLPDGRQRAADNADMQRVNQGPKETATGLAVPATSRLANQTDPIHHGEPPVGATPPGMVQGGIRAIPHAHAPL